MAPKQHIAIDAMGGDFGPRFCVPASLKFLKNHPHISATLVGDSDQIQPLVNLSSVADRVTVQHTNEIVEMDEKPGLALRRKRSSSMWIALQLLAEGKADACVSAGNTGALMGMGRHLIKSIDGIHRPAICKPMPTAKGVSYLLDLGANLECSAEQLYQFALMGVALARLNGVRNPKVSLLNVGSEKTKGGVEIQEAARLIKRQKDFNFVGFMEGDAIFSGEVDVIVCDGFAGNVALKVSEGVAKFAVQTLKEEVDTSLIKRFLSLPLGIVLKSWWKKYNPSLYNGAALLGLKKIVVKSHGGADQLGFYKAIEAAVDQVNANMASRIEKSLQNKPEI